MNKSFSDIFSRKERKLNPLVEDPAVPYSRGFGGAAWNRVLGAFGLSARAASIGGRGAGGAKERHVHRPSPLPQHEFITLLL